MSFKQVDADFWRGKRVLVTGHTGFKGSWLSLWLQSMQARVYGLALEPTTQPNLYTEARVGDGMCSNLEDIRDYEKVLAVVEKAAPEVVFHLAAQPLVHQSYRSPVETYATNVMGTAHILEAARQFGEVSAIVNVTSDKCYENREWFWGYREDEPMGGYDPYSSSKGCSELVTSAFRRSFFSDSHTAIASARAGNVIGGGDWTEGRLVPDVLRAFTKQQAASIRNPNSIRPWQHVLDPLNGYLVLAERLYEEGGSWAEAWNFGPSDDGAQTVAWVVTQLANEWGEEADWTSDSAEHPHEAQYLKLDNSKAVARLNWKPRWGIATALGAVTEWHRAWYSGGNAQDICLRQIERFIV